MSIESPNLDAAHDRLHTYLGLRPERPITVQIWDPGRFDARYAGLFRFPAAGFYGGVIHVRGETRVTTYLQRVLHHELVHAAQQALPGSEAVLQREPAEGDGPGRTPPVEDVVRAEEPARSEDGHVLFGFDSADLSEGDQASLRSLVEGKSGPLTVRVHGYAGEEGVPEYSYNLSAQRAAAVKRYLESILPGGSRVIAYGHGETGAWGEETGGNRRVGVDVVEPSSARAGGVLLQPRLTYPPRREELGVYGPLPAVEGHGTTPITLEERGLRRPSIVPPPLPPDKMIRPGQAPPRYDVTELSPAYAGRGVLFSDRDARSLQAHFELWYRNYLALGMAPDAAEWLAQTGTTVAGEAALTLEHPTPFESFDKKFDREPTVVPVFNDAMLRALIEWARKR